MAQTTKAQAWADTLAAQATSGLTKQAFCEQRGINAATFYAWQRKLREAKQPNIDSTGFTRLITKPTHELTICLPQGDVRLRSDSAATIAQVLKELAHA